MEEHRAVGDVYLLELLLVLLFDCGHPLLDELLILQYHGFDVVIVLLSQLKYG